MAMPTLLDIAKRNGRDGLVPLIDEASKAHPELRVMPARTVKGTQYKTLIRTTVPTGSSFRAANAGVTPAKSGYENRLVECFIFNKRWECDKAVADASEDGRDAYIANEAGGIMEGGFQDLSSQIYYGIGAGGQAAGFPGFINQYDATNRVVDAAGTTDSTCSSVWMPRFGPGHIQLVLGQNGSLELGDVRTESIVDPNAATKRLTAYVQEILAWVGIQVGSLDSLVRIKKLTADSGKGLTDDLLAAALVKFPAGTGPDMVLMNRRSLGQLQNSRTATNPTGAPAPFPTFVTGMDGREIPIGITDAILSTETLTL